MGKLLRLMTGGYRLVWRTLTVTLLVWRVRLIRAVWGGDDAAHLITHARKHAVVPLLRALGATVGPGADIEPHLIIHNAHDGLRHLAIGPGCHVGKASFLDLAAPITLEPHCTLSMGVTLLTHLDVGQTPLRDGPYPIQRGSITVGEGAYIGANATILHGVRVGRCAVVAAGAVVREDVPDYTVVGGVPARLVKHLDPKTIDDGPP
jgi:acetyltransferase-like isoleucine patch superfamily enzyme